MATRRELITGGLVAAGAVIGTARAAGPRKFRIAVVGDYEARAERADWQRLGDDVEVQFFREPFASEADTARALRKFNAVAMMRERTPLPRAVIERLPELELIVFTGPSNATLDYAAAVEHKITVCNAVQRMPAGAARPAAGGGTPAELTLALMLACAWNLPAADALVRRGGWAFQPGIPLQGKVLGIAGYGNLGKPVARYGLALGMKVLGWSRSLTEEAARADGITRADKDRVVAESDVISIHLPATKETVGIISAQDIQKMKPGVFLINTARARIVDQPAMIAALRSRHIAMAGLDVFEQEPLPRNHPLLKLPNVVMTPHVGYVNEASLAGMYDATINTLLAYHRGAPINIYKPS